MAVIPIHCSQCMASVEIDDEKGKGICEYCGTTVMLKKEHRQEAAKSNAAPLSSNSGADIFSSIGSTVAQASRTTSKIIWITSIVVALIIVVSIAIPTIRWISGVSDIAVVNPGVTTPGTGGAGGVTTPETGGGGAPSGGAIVGAGQHRVGEGQVILPGEFLVIQTSGSFGSMTVTRTPDARPGTSSPDFIFIRNFTNRAFVRLDEGDWINLTRASLFRVDDVEAVDMYAESWPEGEYLVGVDIRPGLYRLTQTSGSFGSVIIRTVPNARTSSADFVMIDNFSGQRYVTLRDGMYIEFMRATITRVGDL